MITNQKLITIFCDNKKSVEEYFSDNNTINRIKSRKNLPKFGKATNIEQNKSFTTISTEKYNFIINSDDEKEVAKKQVKSIKCRYCDGDHMSFKCKSKKPTLKMTNLPSDITEEELLDLLSEYGIIDKVTIPSVDDMIKSAFIKLNNFDTAMQIRDELDDTVFDDNVIRVFMD
jgi:RNA recognition motif-containing protein